MGYNATCDASGCNRAVETPLLLGQFNPDAIRTMHAGGLLSNMGYSEGDTITLCDNCTLELLG